MDSKKSIDQRTKNWCLVVYPESAPEDWREILNSEHIPWVESPLHDKDVNATGEPKKAHWHVVVFYSSKKSFEQIKCLTDRLNAPIPQKCADSRGAVRYMAHMDNPEKCQYCASDIVAHGGADIARYLSPTTFERYSLIREMQSYIRENHVLEYQDIMDYAAENHFEDWYPLLCDSCSYVIMSYIKSLRNRFYPNGVDPVTGEVKNDEK